MGNGRKKRSENPFADVDGLDRKGQAAFAVISEKMVKSEAYQDLSDGAKHALTICKLCRQYYVGKDKDGQPRMLNGDILQFYFNRKIQKHYGLGNPNRLRKEMIELVKHGFIDVIEVNWTTKTSNVYRFDWKWSQWKPGQELTLSSAADAFIRGRKN